MTISDLPTPCLLVEQKRARRNIERMQALANVESVQLRPHVKTHKSVHLAKLQMAAGASGLAVAKPSEAAVFAAAGINDIRIAYTLATRHHFEALVSLTTTCRVSFCVDTIAAAQAASDRLFSAGLAVDVLIEIDSEYGRCGIRWDSPDLPAFARAVERLPGLKVKGILCHAGQSYSGAGEDGQGPGTAVKAAAEKERACMLAVANRLRDERVEGVEPGVFEISIGSTPAMKYFRNETNNGFSITEIRPGNYIFNDAMQVSLGTAGMKDCAMTVLTSVVSKHRDRNGGERLYLDAGRKVLTSDTGPATNGFGVLLHSPKTMLPLPHAQITGLSEEHAWVSLHGGSTLEVGDRVRVVPNHACTVVNTQDQLHIVDRDTVVETVPVDARGMSK